MTGTERNSEQIRRYPLTGVMLMAFSLTVAFGLIYIFAFSDTAEDRWQHFYTTFAASAFVGTCFVFATKREDKSPLPLGVRRLIWSSMVGVYALAAAGVLLLGVSPFSKFSDVLRMVCYLGAAAPLAYLPWHFLRTEKKG